MSAPVSRPSRAIDEVAAIAASGGRGVSLPQLAHELNSLLDGSIRSLGLAERALDEDSSAVPATGLAEALGRLRIAREALSSMAMLLDRTLAAGSTSDVGIFNREETLGSVVGRMLRAVLPMAGEQDVDLDSFVAPNVDGLPARTLEPVILNGLRNAIRSSARGGKPRSVTLKAHIDADRIVTISILDTGPGVPADFALGASGEPGGHGLGLELSNRIVSDLAGRLTLESLSVGGASLCVTIPAASLEQP